MPKPNHHTIGLIPQANGLYCMSIAPQGTTNGPEEALAASGKITISKLHQRMGHINHEDLLKMVKEKTIIGIDLHLESKPELCPQCIEAKAMNRPFPKLSISNRAKAYGDKIVSDLCGPSPTASLKGKRYYIIFQDGFTHEQHVYFLSKKSEAFKIYKIYEAWVNTQRNAKIKIFGTDRGGEFTGAAFKAHLKKARTVHHLTCTIALSQMEKQKEQTVPFQKGQQRCSRPQNCLSIYGPRLLPISYGSVIKFPPKPFQMQKHHLRWQPEPIPTCQV